MLLGQWQNEQLFKKVSAFLLFFNIKTFLFLKDISIQLSPADRNQWTGPAAGEATSTY